MYNAKLSREDFAEVIQHSSSEYGQIRKTFIDSEHVT